MLQDLRKHSIIEYEIDEILLWVMGFLSPMLLLYVGGNSLFLYLMLLCTGWCIFNFIVKQRGEIVVVSDNKWIIGISILSFISITICIKGPLEDYWKDGESAQYIWTIMYLVFFLFYSAYNNRGYVVYYIKGVYWSAVFQTFWAVGQFWLFESREISLNDLVFKDILHMENSMGQYSSHKGNVLSLSGMCWHPSNMAPLLTIGYSLSNNIYTKMLFTIIAVLSGNRTSIIGIAICIVTDVFMWISKHKGVIITHKYSFVMLIITVIIFLYIWLGDSGIIDRAEMLINIYLERMNDFTGSENAHIGYWLKTPEALKDTPLVNIFFGYGPNCSGYMGTKYLNLYVRSKWVLECDYMDCLWANGVLGLIMRYSFYIWGAIKALKKEKRLLPMILSFAIMGITYNFLCTWCLLFVYCIIIYWSMDKDTY